MFWVFSFFKALWSRIVARFEGWRRQVTLGEFLSPKTLLWVLWVHNWVILHINCGYVGCLEIVWNSFILQHCALGARAFYFYFTLAFNDNQDLWILNTSQHHVSHRVLCACVLPKTWTLAECPRSIQTCQHNNTTIYIVFLHVFAVLRSFFRPANLAYKEVSPDMPWHRIVGTIVAFPAWFFTPGNASLINIRSLVEFAWLAVFLHKTKIALDVLDMLGVPPILI